MLSHFPDYDVDDDDFTVNFKCWVAVDRSDLITQTLPTIEYVELLLNKELYKRIPHSFIAKSQGAYFKERKETLKVGEVLVNMDFAENYSFVIQNEIQGYHWTSNNCTVHPVVCYYKKRDGNTGGFKTTHQSLCFIFDELDHGVPMVYAIQSKVINVLKGIVDGFFAVKYFTDGCAEQYNNYKSFSNIVYHLRDFNIIGTWSFFATSQVLL